MNSDTILVHCETCTNTYATNTHCHWYQLNKCEKCGEPLKKREDLLNAPQDNRKDATTFDNTPGSSETPGSELWNGSPLGGA